MLYSKFGNTGVKISKLGFGCMRFPMITTKNKTIIDEDKTISLLKEAYALGVNYFDTAYFYCNHLSENVVGKALKEIRNNVIVSTKCPGDMVKKPGDARKILEEQLTKLDMNYIDFYHFHGIGYDNFIEIDKKSNWLKDFQKAKDEGLIKHISFSFHDKPENLKKLVDIGCFESLLCQYNLIDRSNEEGIAYAKSKGLGVVVMGPLAGGKVAELPKNFIPQQSYKNSSVDMSEPIDEIIQNDFSSSNIAPKVRLDKFEIPQYTNQDLGLRFVLSNQNIDCAISGMSTDKMLKENVASSSNTNTMSYDEINAINILMQEKAEIAKLYCTDCKYCMPCPQEVNIPFIFAMMNQKRVYELDGISKDGYAGIGSNPWTQGKKADACIECGICETKCPQKIKIMQQLKESHEALI